MDQFEMKRQHIYGLGEPMRKLSTTHMSQFGHPLEHATHNEYFVVFLIKQLRAVIVEAI
jgi:hypothetical protein